MMRLGAGTVVALLMLAGCTGGQGACASSTGSFSCGQQVSNKNDTMSQEWNNPGTAAQVSWGGQVASGSLDIQLLDSKGTRVYSHTVQGTTQGGFNERSSTGAPGTWHVRLVYHSFTGQMGLSVTQS